jgi:DamX protein
MAETPGGRTPQAYFDTPERAERLQLVAHVARNTDIVPYVRGPEGSGKSRFAERLAAIFRQEASLVFLAGGTVADVPAAICEALGATTERWPASAMDAASENGLLVIADDVDRMDAASLQQLQALRAVGARLIILGSKDPAGLPADWQVQLIDLPPLSEVQLKDFLRFIGDARAQSLTGADLARLHRECQGLPGRVIAASAGERVAPANTRVPARRNLLRGTALLAAVVVVAGVLWQQDRINALFQPQGDQAAQAEPEIIPVEPLPTRAGEAGSVEQAGQAATNEPPVFPLQERHGEKTAEPVTREGAVETATPTVAETGSVVDSVPPGPDESPLSASPDETGETVEQSAAQGTPAERVQAPSAASGAAAEMVAEVPQAIEPQPVGGQQDVEPAASAGPATEALAAHAATGPHGLAWLRSRQANAMTLQLVGARDRAAIDAFIAKHELSGDYVVYERDLGGKPWFTLVFGDYPDRTAALRARSALPRALHKAWPRTFESIWQQLPPAD